MRQLADLYQLEKARSSFYRMDWPENPVYHFVIDLRTALFHGKKVRLNRSHVLAALGQILLNHLVVKIDHRSSFLKSLCQRSGFFHCLRSSRLLARSRPGIHLASTSASCLSSTGFAR